MYKKPPIIWSFESDMKHCRGSWFVDYMPNNDPNSLTRSYRYFCFVIHDE